MLSSEGAHLIEVALVSGASGFVGRRLCEKLKTRDVEVRGIARHRVEGPWDQLVNLDLTSSSVPDEFTEGVDAVFHLAGKVHALSELGSDQAEYEYANVVTTQNLLEAAKRNGVKRFVFFSSVKAGGEGGDVCLDEAMDDNPETVYGRSKLEAERLVFKFARDNGIHAVVLRLPLVYGRGSKGNLLRMLDAISARRFPPLPEFGNQRSMVHVDDAAEAAILAAESPRTNMQTYIVTDGRPYSTREIYTLMCLALGRSKPCLSNPVSALRAAARLGDIIGRIRGRRFVFDSDALDKLASSAWYSSRKIETELGFKPSYDLESALPEMVAELRNRRKHEAQVAQPL